MGEFYDIGHEPGDRPSAGAGWLGGVGRRSRLDAEPTKLGSAGLRGSLCLSDAG